MAKKIVSFKLLTGVDFWLMNIYGRPLGHDPEWITVRFILGLELTC
jgi:hypothetical protein